MAGVELIKSYHAHSNNITAITFTDIPQSYKHLWFHGKLAGDSAYLWADST